MQLEQTWNKVFNNQSIRLQRRFDFRWKTASSPRSFSGEDPAKINSDRNKIRVWVADCRTIHWPHASLDSAKLREAGLTDTDNKQVSAYSRNSQPSKSFQRLPHFWCLSRLRAVVLWNYPSATPPVLLMNFHSLAVCSIRTLIFFPPHQKRREQEKLYSCPPLSFSATFTNVVLA